MPKFKNFPKRLSNNDLNKKKTFPATLNIFRKNSFDLFCDHCWQFAVTHECLKIKQNFSETSYKPSEKLTSLLNQNSTIVAMNLNIIIYVSLLFIIIIVVIRRSYNQKIDITMDEKLLLCKFCYISTMESIAGSTRLYMKLYIFI